MNERLILRMRRSLSEPASQPVWPEGIRIVPFEPERHAPEIHALLAAAYAKGGGYVEPLSIWWPSLKGDSEYDPALCFIATDEQDRILGVAQCWTSAFIKDLAVSPNRRGQGLGSALICEALQAFQKRGAAHVDLKVDADNPSGALRLYRTHGFEEIESYRLD
jgi:ribosomal protein S18 acetylase RimI-like enzyme